jgi:hypothetical protein
MSKPRILRMVGIGSGEPDAATEEALLVGIAAISGRKKYKHKSFYISKSCRRI